MKEEPLYRCTVCGRVGTVGRCCGLETRYLLIPEYQPARVILNFDHCKNYQGHLQVKAKNGHYYWRVCCDMDEEAWTEIPEYLFDSLLRHYNQGD